MVQPFRRCSRLQRTPSSRLWTRDATAGFSLSGRSGTAEIVVRDSGPGVMEQRRSLVFEPYFTGREGGDGLGLFFARRLALGIGGDILLEEEGTAFRLVMP